jgi:hypothetical protein
MASAWSRSFEPGGSTVTNSTSVASTRPAWFTPAEAARPASASTSGEKSGSSPNSDRMASKSGCGRAVGDDTLSP